LFGKHIAVLMGFVSSIAIAWHARNVTERDILMRRQWCSVRGLCDRRSTYGNLRACHKGQRQ
jgi:hypothetical protein